MNGFMKTVLPLFRLRDADGSHGFRERTKTTDLDRMKWALLGHLWREAHLMSRQHSGEIYQTDPNGPAKQNTERDVCRVTG